MANELHGISSIKSPQDNPLDHAKTQPLQVIIPVPDTAEHSNSGNGRGFCYRFGLSIYVISKITLLYYFIILR